MNVFPWDKIDDLYLLTLLCAVAVDAYLIGDSETRRNLASAASGAIAMYVKEK